MSEDEPKKSSNIKLSWIRRWDNILQTLAIEPGASIPGNLSEDEQKKLPNIKSYSRYISYHKWRCTSLIEWKQKGLKVRDSTASHLSGGISGVHVTYLSSNIFWKLSTSPPFAFFSSILLFKFCPHPLCWPPSCTWQGYHAQKVVIQGTSCPWIWLSISRVEMKAISHLYRTPNIHAKPSKLLHRSSVPSNQGLPNLIIKYMEWCCLYLKSRFLFGTDSGMGVKYFIANSQPSLRSYFILLAALPVVHPRFSRSWTPSAANPLNIIHCPSYKRSLFHLWAK